MENAGDEVRGSGVRGMRPPKSLPVSSRSSSRAGSRAEGEEGRRVLGGEEGRDRRTRTVAEATRVLPSRSMSRTTLSEGRGGSVSRGGSRGSERGGESARGGEAAMKQEGKHQPSLGTETRRKKRTQLELEELKQKLHDDEGRPFSRLQKHLLDKQEEDEKLSLQQALLDATGMSLSEGAMEELGRLSGTYRDYSKILNSLWDERMLHRQTEVEEKRKGPSHAPRYLFFYNRPAGFYNDNIEPSPHFYGVKKSSSSVRYNLFTNERTDMLAKTLPRSFVDRLDAEMKIVPANHPVTKRPLDPWLCHLSIGQV
uniref:Uncharacterized protein n=1 Tax=Guillardia theta TaxID=55529 RepID=A0A7S4KZ12_GUITH|mmetsp:Transcript_34134/g.106923  ORF Transcript_34134/g.106923 Transcript_34134/m.106923 type:complete len:312 (+) Transcript_34134:192-1127(+)